MRQLAWLEYDGRGWVLLMDLKDDVPTRRWNARETALAELAEEGWIVAGPYPQRLLTIKSEFKKYYGYALVRILQ